MDYTVHGILQARILEWVAFPSPGDLPKPGISSCGRGFMKMESFGKAPHLGVQKKIQFSNSFSLK